MSSFRYKWYSKGDVDAYLGLLFDSISKVLSASGILLFAFQMPSEIVFKRILPGIAIATFAGNVWYAIEAFILARKENRQDVTAQPYGLGAGQVFGWLFLIIGPVYFHTNDPVIAWQVGVAACFVGGFIEVIGAFFAKYINIVFSQYALLGNLAGAALIYLSLVGMVNIFDKPLIAVIPMLIVLIFYFGKIKIPFGIPVGLLAVLSGTIIAWITGAVTPLEIKQASENLQLSLPSFAGGDIIAGLSYIRPFLPIIIPLQIQNFLSTLQSIESAALAGDRYPVKSCMVADGVGTIIGSLFGNPFPTTVFIGHPCWKRIGARSAYSVFCGLTYLIVCFTGMVGVISAVIPYQVVMCILLYVGLEFGQQVFNDGKKYSGAILLGFLPIIAQYILQTIESTVTALGQQFSQVDLELFDKASVPIRGIMALANGSFLTSMLFIGWLINLMDEKYKNNIAVTSIMLICSATGIIHSQTVAILPADSMPFTVIYIILLATSIAMSLFIKPQKNKII